MAAALDAQSEESPVEPKALRGQNSGFVYYDDLAFFKATPEAEPQQTAHDITTPVEADVADLARGVAIDPPVVQHDLTTPEGYASAVAAGVVGPIGEAGEPGPSGPIVEGTTVPVGEPGPPGVVETPVVPAVTSPPPAKKLEPQAFADSRYSKANKRLRGRNK